jgi:hypothetical protein
MICTWEIIGIEKVFSRLVFDVGSLCCTLLCAITSRVLIAVLCFSQGVHFLEESAIQGKKNMWLRTADS